MGVFYVLFDYPLINPKFVYIEQRNERNYTKIREKP